MFRNDNARSAVAEIVNLRIGMRRRSISGRPSLQSCSLKAVALQIASSRSKAGSAYRHRFGERRQLHNLLVPRGEFGMPRPPRLVGVAEVEIAQGAADRDLTDRVEVAERGRLLLELDDG